MTTRITITALTCFLVGFLVGIGGWAAMLIDTAGAAFR